MTYYHVRITLKSNPSHTEVELDISLEKLRERFVQPYIKGSHILINGRALSVEDIERININKTGPHSIVLNATEKLLQEARSSRMLVDHNGRLPAWVLADKGEDVTGEFIAGPPGYGVEESFTVKQNPRSNTSMRIFISHSSNDVQVAKLLVELLGKALNLKSDAIRCTSVDGYRMQAGVPVDERLRTEVHEAELLVGIITPASVRSPYVMFELGARWGAGKPMIPLLASGATTEHLGGPLAGINALDSREGSQLHQLLEEAAQHLSVTLEKTSSYAAAVQELVKQPRRPLATLEQQSTDADSIQISEDARELLVEATKDRNGSILVVRKMGGTKIQANGRQFVETGNRRSEARWEQSIRDIFEQGFIQDPTGKGQVFKVTDTGFQAADEIAKSA